MSARRRAQKQGTPEEASPKKEIVLVTGYPSSTARHLMELLVKDGHDVRMLVMEHFVEQAQKEADEAVAEGPGSCKILAGDVTHLDLGLSGQEISEILEEASVVHHSATIYHLGSKLRDIYNVNVEGTRRVLGLAREMKQLRRFCHYSTAQVAGTREGVIMEDELEAGQEFFNAFEESKFKAERLIRQVADIIPVSIFRPSIIVGNSKTGAVDSLSGPHLLLALFVNLPPKLPLPLPGRGHFPLNIVPVDYVAEAAYRLSIDPRAEGRTFHVTDPSPMSVRGVFNLVSDLVRRPRPLDAAANLLPYRVARAALSLPFVQQRTNGALALIDALHSLAIYNRMGTDELLAHTGTPCPPFPTYADRLVRNIRRLAPRDFDVQFDAEDV